MIISWVYNSQKEKTNEEVKIKTIGQLTAYTITR